MNKTILTGFCALLVATDGALAQGTAFTYQGRLVIGTNAANGIYDLRFGLFNAVSAGAQIGPLRTNSPVTVSNGFFAVTLDFTNGAFPGADRWLDIGVRTNGNGTFTTLTLRQKITPAPYAIMAAGVSSSGIAGTYNNAVNFLNVGNAFSGDGSDLTGLSAFQLASGTVPDARLAANIPRLNGNNEFTGLNGLNNRDLRLRNAGDGNHGLGWYGTAGTNKPFAGVDVDGPALFGFGSGVLGTMATGQKIVLLWNSSGNVGIGTNAPQQQLSLAGGMNIDQAGLNNGAIDGGLRFGSFSGEGIGSKRTGGGNQFGLDFYTAGFNRVAIRTSGEVGIGTVNPAAKLDVNGSVRASGVINAVGGLVIENRTSDPASPATGQIWLRTDL